MLSFDLQADGLSQLQELRASRDGAEILQLALEKDLFTAVDEGLSQAELSDRLGLDQKAGALFLQVLLRLGLLGCAGEDYFNTPASAKYLVSHSPDNAREALLAQESCWSDIAAKLGGYFAPDLKGAAHNNTPHSQLSQSLVRHRPGLDFTASGPWDFVITEDVNSWPLNNLTDAGFLVVLGRFAELGTVQGAMDALQQYCQKGEEPASASEVNKALQAAGLTAAPLINLDQVWGAIIASPSPKSLARLLYNEVDRLQALLRQEAIRSLKLIDVKDIVTAPWVATHCRWGCSSYGTKHCPPKSPALAETRDKLATYHRALLIEGEPPTRGFQRLMLECEKTAFKAGFYKAFAYWAGPCSLCTECKMPEPPQQCTATRPSMESAGMDVFATVRRQGYTLETRKDKTEFVKYFGLLLLD